jgi:NitT/TauT family transport system ATP-binding protein
MVAGLTPSSGGSITINGKDVDGPYGDYGFVFQAPSLMPWRTVLQNVLFPMDVLKRNDSAALQRARELLALVGLSDFAASRPHQLSGGMQQRVALCRAFWCTGRTHKARNERPFAEDPQRDPG